MSAKELGYYIETPLVDSKIKNISTEILFKYDYLQPSGSFKDRGISNMIYKLCNNKDQKITKLICSSGGNAGLSVATIGQKMGLPVNVYIPITTMPLMIDKIKDTGANVIVGGKNWNEADEQAKIELSSNNEALYVPPFDHPLIWEGNESIIDEIKASIGDDETLIPDAIVLSTGGGGMLCGVLQGIERVGWRNKVKVIVVETTGTASYSAAKAAGSIVKLHKIDSIATSLGALAVSHQCLNTNVTTKSAVVTDKEAVEALLRFSLDHRVLVEPACGASLSIAYNEELRHKYLKNYKKVIVLVCGGSGVSIELINKWKDMFNIV